MELIGQLNPQQLEAVTHDGDPLLVLAGAGSGKTRVITYRIVYLIKYQGIDPYNILAVTFTNKAAGEMKERVCALLGKSLPDLWISTFHSFCARLLHIHAQDLGYKDNFVIYDTKDSIALIKEIMSGLNIYLSTITPQSVHYTIDRAKNNLIPPNLFMQRANNSYLQAAAEIYRRYQEQLFMNNAFDFCDLLMKVVELFEGKPEVLEKYQKRFQHILVDEYQDTNHAQFVLLRHLTGIHKNICVVGDDDQSIYRFRGADISNILSFEKHYPGAKVIKLEQNYRSTQHILDVATKIAEGNPQRKAKTLWTSNKKGEKAKLYYASDERDEVIFVLKTIQYLIGKDDLKYGDFAVFYRTNAQSRIFEEIFSQEGIPYVVIGSVGFYDRMEIKDLLAYVKMLLDPYDSLSARRIINVPRRGIGKTTIQLVDEYSKERSLHFMDALKECLDNEIIPSISRGKVKEFLSLIEELSRDMEKLDALAFMRNLIEKIGYMEYLEEDKSLSAQDRKENVNELLNAIARFIESNSGISIADFLDRATLTTTVDTYQQKEGAVNLMTLHSSKGLEFPVVFLCGLEEDLLPHLHSKDDQENIHEERRLCYVGCTRAQRELYLLHAYCRMLGGRTYYPSPSRFIEEIPQDLLEQIPSKMRKVKQDFGYGPQRSQMQQAYSVSSQAAASEREFLLGMRVHHPIYGKGVVVAVNDPTVVAVSFNSVGIRKIKRDSDKLKISESY